MVHCFLHAHTQTYDDQITSYCLYITPLRDQRCSAHTFWHSHLQTDIRCNYLQKVSLVHSEVTQKYHYFPYYNNIYANYNPVKSFSNGINLQLCKLKMAVGVILYSYWLRGHACFTVTSLSCWWPTAYWTPRTSSVLWTIRGNRSGMLFGHIFFPDTPLRTTVKVDTPQQKNWTAPAGYDGDKAMQQKLGKKTLCREHPQASSDGH